MELYHQGIKFSTFATQKWTYQFSNYDDEYRHTRYLKNVTKQLATKRLLFSSTQIINKEISRYIN